jgi:hypothetical protein
LWAAQIITPIVTKEWRGGGELAKWAGFYHQYFIK